MGLVHSLDIEARRRLYTWLWTQETQYLGLDRTWCVVHGSFEGHVGTTHVEPSDAIATVSEL